MDTGFTAWKGRSEAVFLDFVLTHDNADEQLQCLQDILGRGFPVNMPWTAEDDAPPECLGATLLHCAMAGNNAVDRSKIVAVLAWHGADVNARDAAGMTPLLHGLRNCCHVGTMQALVDAGASLSCRADDGTTAVTALLQPHIRTRLQWLMSVCGELVLE